MTDEGILSGIAEVARAHLGWEGILTPDLRLVEDLRLDSIRLLTLAAEVENRFRVLLDEADDLDRRFPPADCGGVVVINAPSERELSALLDRIDRHLFHADLAEDCAALPLAGRKLQLNTDWGRDED